MLPFYEVWHVFFALIIAISTSAEADFGLTMMSSLLSQFQWQSNLADSTDITAFETNPQNLGSSHIHSKIWCE